MAMTPTWSSVVSAKALKGFMAPTVSNERKELELSVDEMRRSVRNESDCEALDLLAFSSAEEALRRGVGLFTTMHAGGRIFAKAAGTEWTYSLSESTVRLQAFLSHNWVVPRWRKFLALALHYNVKAASALAFCTMCAVLAVTHTCSLPTVYNKLLGSRLTCLPILFMAPTLVLGLLVAHELPLCLRRRGPKVFLDKVCIHQTDEALKGAGIHKLGAFLFASKGLIILYSDVYLTKLWTAYEVATFLTCRGLDKIIFLSVDQALFIFIALGLTWVGQFMLMAATAMSDSEVVLLVTPFGAVSLFALVSRYWAKQSARMLKRLRTFSVKDCIVAVESDRALVYNNIELIVKLRGIAEQSATTEQALDAFDRVVRHEMPLAMKHLIGGLGLTYPQVMLIACCLASPFAFDNYLDWPPQKRVAMTVSFASHTFVCWPGAIIIIARLARKKMQLSGARELAWIVAVSASATALSGGCILFSVYAALAASTSIWVLLLWALGVLLAAFGVRAWALLYQHSEHFFDGHEVNSSSSEGSHRTDAGSELEPGEDILRGSGDEGSEGLKGLASRGELELGEGDDLARGGDLEAGEGLATPADLGLGAEGEDLAAEPAAVDVVSPPEVVRTLC